MKFKIQNKEAGFSLIELMIVVGIIGILAALAVPKMQVFLAKSRQSEAKGTLSHYDSLAKSFYAENNGYGSSAEIGFIAAANALYTLKTDSAAYVPATPATTYSVEFQNARPICAGVAANADVWSVDQNKTLRNNGNTAPFPAPACT